MITIQKNTVAVINYTLHTIDDELIDDGNQIAYIHGHENLLSGMEEALEGNSIGAQIDHKIVPEKAFGPTIENNPIQVPRSQFGEDFDKIYQGMGIPTRDENGKEIFFYVQEKNENHAILTLNHPLAGIPLFFKAQVIAVRDALEDEIDGKTAFGADGDKKPSSCSCC